MGLPTAASVNNFLRSLQKDKMQMISQQLPYDNHVRFGRLRLRGGGDDDDDDAAALPSSSSPSAALARFRALTQVEGPSLPGPCGRRPVCSAPGRSMLSVFHSNPRHTFMAILSVRADFCRAQHSTLADK
ncbi:Hypothetical predicted protein [Podarcis lilfordi]|uniref:Uncharacterized protein n=1 Tax=Podarcis lilfordi TaxID=74358 RepID=A0AA35KP59_9SAUR|nr:Hypothetical predicted protein [Podarcis lilfordi]